VTADSTAGADAELLIGDVLRAGRNPERVAAHYQKYLEQRPRGIRVDEARFRLAEALEQLHRIPDALAAYRRVTVNAPLSNWAAPAEKRIAELVRRLSKARRKLYGLSADQHIERGLAYFAASRNELAEAEFAAALATPGLEPAKACVAAYHRGQSVWQQRNRERSAPLFDRAIEICERANNPDLLVKSYYQAGRSYARIGQHQKAIDLYATCERTHPEHSYADDCRLRQAEEYRDLNDQAKVTELLSAIPERYPQGDMKAEALWRLGWRAFKEKRYDEALSWLKKQVEVVPIDTNWWAEGQAQYWTGRAHAELGNQSAAADAYENTVLTYPLSYYSLLALNRLRESKPERFEKLLARIAAPPAGENPGDPVFEFKPRPLYQKPSFKRALEFLRLGLAHRAEIEFTWVGLTPPPGKKPLTDPDRIEEVWAMAYLYDAAGLYEQSHWVTRWHVLDYKRSWPAGKNRARWRIAYPRAYWPLLSLHARKHNYPTELLIAFVREESAFDPLRESWANAIGLTQMRVVTARDYSKGTGIPVSRESLRDPEKNVTIGSRFLASLMTRWNGRVALAVPSYNTGPNRVARWVRERAGWTQDAWSEEIPDDEPRRYSNRVITSYFAYTYLENGSVPFMPNDLPAESAASTHRQ
jgi:soluble lytic murein transglycosylase